MLDNSTIVEKLEKLNIWNEFIKKCNRDQDYGSIALVQNIGKCAIQELKAVIKYMGNFTLHDDTHIFNMLYIIDDLIPEDILDKLTTPDLMLIFLCVFLHDIGMCPTEEEKKVILGEKKTDDKWLINERKKYSELKKTKLLQTNMLNDKKEDDSDILATYFRNTHSERSRVYINRKLRGQLKYKGVDITAEVADICYSHGEDIDYVRDNIDTVASIADSYSCLKFVAIILRLADVIDFDPSRAPEILMEHIDLNDTVAVGEWIKHQNVRACSIVKGNSIVCAAKCNHPAIEYSIRKFCDYIDDELKNATYIFSLMNATSYNKELSIYKNFKIPVRVDRTQIGPAKDDEGRYLYKYHETSFTLNKTQIIDLLMGTKLYNSPKIAIRELLQNSLDACMLRKTIAESNSSTIYKPRISIYYRNTDNGTELIVEDNGVGMNQNIIDHYYTDIGNSYYKSDEYYQLITSNNIEFNPISKFGIGILSCFMVADELEVQTRRIPHGNSENEALSVTIEGYNSLFVIRPIDMENYGTKTTLKLRDDEPWKNMDKEEFENCIKSILKTPPFPVYIFFKDESVIKYETSPENTKSDLQTLQKKWDKGPNIKDVEFLIDEPEFGFRGIANVAFITQLGNPVEYIKTSKDNVSIQDKVYEISVVYSYDEYGIFRSSDSLSIDDNNEVGINSNYTTKMESYAEISLHGITIPRNLFVDFNSQDRTKFIQFPLPTILIIDIYDKTDLNLNSARTDVIADEKWKLFEKRIVLTLCKKLKENIGNNEWKRLQKIILKKIIDPDIKNVVRKMKIE